MAFGDRRYNFFLSLPAHLCHHIHNWNIVAWDVKHQYTHSFLTKSAVKMETWLERAADMHSMWLGLKNKLCFHSPVQENIV